VREEGRAGLVDLPHGGSRVDTIQSFLLSLVALVPRPLEVYIALLEEPLPPLVIELVEGLGREVR